MRKDARAVGLFLTLALAATLVACGGSGAGPAGGASYGGAANGQPAAAAQSGAASTAGGAKAEPRSGPAGIKRVNGTVGSATGSELTLTGGQHFRLTAKTRVIQIASAGAGALRVGQFVAVTAKRQANNTLLASIVNIFPQQMRGVGVGQRPMAGGNLMTNATIQKVQGGTFTVTFPGGGAHVTLAPGAHVNRMTIAGVAALKPGSRVSVAGAGGNAAAVMIEPSGGA